MSFSTSLQPLLIIFSAAAGLILGGATELGTVSAALIEPFLMTLLFFVFLSMDMRGIGQAFRNIRFTASSLIINFIWTPIFAFFLGLVFLGGSLDLRTGFLMLMATPCTDWFLVFTGLSKGNTTLGAAILPLNLLLQVVLLPVYLLVFMGSALQVQPQGILASILLVLAIPFAAARLVRWAAAHTGRPGRLDKLHSSGDTVQLALLCCAIICMFASESRQLLDNPILLLRMLPPVAAFFAVNFLLAQAVGRMLRFPFTDTVSLTMTTLARNSPLSLAIAVAAFPGRSLISLALVIGPLIELPVLSVVSNLLLRMGESHHTKGPTDA